MPLIHPIVEQAGLLKRQLTRLAATPITLARPYFVKRRFHAYSAGMGKSGTHSLAGIFRNYRAAHEPEDDVLIPVIINKWGKWTPAQRASYVRKRDRRLWLELEASHLLHELNGTLVSEFPEAKFILTMRDVYSWLESHANQSFNNYIASRWIKLAHYRVPRDQLAYTPYDKHLAEYDIAPLESMIKRWTNHHRRMFSTIPRERLLVVYMANLAHSGPALAGFLNIPEDTLDMSQAHLYRAPRSLGIIPKIDPGYLQSKIDEHCSDLMQQHFPHIKTPGDAFSS